MARPLAFLLVSLLAITSWILFPMKTLHGVTTRQCAGCGNSTRKLQRISQEDVFSLYQQGFCLVDRVHNRVCAPCAKDIAPGIFQFTRDATFEDTQHFVKNNMIHVPQKPPVVEGDSMVEESETPTKRHTARTSTGRFEKKPKIEVNACVNFGLLVTFFTRMRAHEKVCIFQTKNPEVEKFIVTPNT